MAHYGEAPRAVTHLTSLITALTEKIITNRILTYTLLATFLTVVLPAYAENHQDYTKKCLKGLGIKKIPSYSCLDGIKTTSLLTGSQSTENYMGRLNVGKENVDAVFFLPKGKNG